MTILRLIEKFSFGVEISLAQSDGTGYMIVVHQENKLESACQARIDRGGQRYGVNSQAYKMARSDARRLIRDCRVNMGVFNTLHKFIEGSAKYERGRK
jgi:hypothetical protein